MNSVKFLGTGSDDQALALKMYLGHFSDAWREGIQLADNDMGVVMRKRVTAGKSFQFLQFADLPDVEDFEPGDEMIGQDFAIGEGTITPDKYLVAHQFVRKDQMAISHVEVLGRLGRAHAMKIRRRRDKRLFLTAVAAARTAAATKSGLTIHNGGNVVTRGSTTVALAYPLSATGAANFRADLRALGYQMDLDSIPAEGRKVWITPYIRQVLLYDTTVQLFSKDYNTGGNDINKRHIMLVEGFEIVGFPNTTTNSGPMPDQNITNELAKYNIDCSLSASTTIGTPVAVALCAGPEGGAAIGEVTYEDVQHYVKYVDEKLGWLIGSYTLQGCGVVDPYCAGTIEAVHS